MALVPKIIQFQTIPRYLKGEAIDNEIPNVYGLGDDGVVYWYDQRTKLWMSITQNKFMVEEK